MVKHNLWSNWQIVFMSDTDKQTLIDLYEILIINNLKEFIKSFEEVVFKFEMRNIICVPCRVWSG